MDNTPLRELQDYGQSVWLDDIRRDWLVGGTLRELIRRDGVSGLTSNPAIFEKAIDSGHDYDAAIAALAGRGFTAVQIVDELTRQDVADAADLLRPVFDDTRGVDGFVSLEVSPHLARDTEGTVREAKRLWAALARPNVMIKVPGTREGIPAMRRLITEGVNVNVTLIFGLARYDEIAEAYMDALEARRAANQPSDTVASVASFFVSRIDTLVDSMLDARPEPAASALRGKVATVCARLAYQHYLKVSAGPRWQSLAAHGARPQRLLWASTSTKDKSYPDIKYVEALIGRDTVNTMPAETMAAYRDHGRPALRLERHLDEAVSVPTQLLDFDVDLGAVADRLEEEGLRKFIEPYDRLQQQIASRLTQPQAARRSG